MIIVYIMLAFFVLMRCGFEITFYFKTSMYYFTIYALERYRLGYESAWIRFESHIERLQRITTSEEYEEIMKKIKDKLE